MPRFGPSGNHSFSVVGPNKHQYKAVSMDFFNLPAEIRLQIYEELLVLSEPIIFNSYRPFRMQQRYGLCPALLRTSKGVHREASPMLYSSNRFEFTEPIPSQKLYNEYAAALT